MKKSKLYVYIALLSILVLCCLLSTQGVQGKKHGHKIASKHSKNAILGHLEDFDEEENNNDIDENVLENILNTKDLAFMDENDEFVEDEVESAESEESLPKLTKGTQSLQAGDPKSKPKPHVVASKGLSTTAKIVVPTLSILCILLTLFVLALGGCQSVKLIVAYCCKGKIRTKYQTLKSRPRRQFERFVSYLPCNTCALISISLATIYFSMGVIFFTLTESGWGLLRTVYFVVVALSSVGYGDLVPSNNISKIGAMFFIGIGMMLVAYALGMVGTILLASSEEKMFKVVQRRVNISASSKTLIEVSRVVFAFFTFIGVLLLGTIVYAYSESWSFLNAAYFSMMTITTVGLGDLRVTTTFSYLFTIFYVIFGTTSAGIAIGAASNFVVERYLHRKHSRRMVLTSEDLRKMDFDKDGRVTKLDFLVYELVHRFGVPTHSIRSIMNDFHKLDRDGSGYLDEQDLIYNVDNIIPLDQAINDDEEALLDDELLDHEPLTKTPATPRGHLTVSLLGNAQKID